MYPGSEWLTLTLESSVRLLVIPPGSGLLTLPLESDVRLLVMSADAYPRVQCLLMMSPGYWWLTLWSLMWGSWWCLSVLGWLHSPWTLVWGSWWCVQVQGGWHLPWSLVWGSQWCLWVLGWSHSAWTLVWGFWWCLWVDVPGFKVVDTYPRVWCEAPDDVAGFGVGDTTGPAVVGYTEALRLQIPFITVVNQSGKIQLESETYFISIIIHSPEAQSDYSSYAM